MHSGRLAAVLCHLPLKSLDHWIVQIQEACSSEHCSLALFVWLLVRSDPTATADSLLHRQYQDWSRSESSSSPMPLRSYRRRMGESRLLESVAIPAVLANHIGAAPIANSFCHSRQHSTCLGRRPQCLQRLPSSPDQDTQIRVSNTEKLPRI